MNSIYGVCQKSGGKYRVFKKSHMIFLNFLSNYTQVSTFIKAYFVNHVSLNVY